MNAQDTANYIFVDFNAESQDDLLGNSRTAPGITPFQFNDCVDEFFIRSFGAKRTFVLVRKQHVVLSFGQHLVEIQKGGRLRTMAERSKRAAPLTYTVILKNEELRPDGFSNR